MDVVWADMKTTLISLYISIRDGHVCLGDQVHCQWAVIFWKEFFFWPEVLNSGLKILNKPCCQQMCYHPGFVLFIEYQQSRFSIILKGARCFRMVNEHWLQLQVASSTSLLQDSQPTLWRHGLLLNSHENPRWLFHPGSSFRLHWEAVVSLATVINDLSYPLDNSCSSYISTCCFALHF